TRLPPSLGHSTRPFQNCSKASRCGPRLCRIIGILDRQPASLQEYGLLGTLNADRSLGVRLHCWYVVVGHTVRTLKSDESQQTGLLPPTDSQSSFIEKVCSAPART